MNIQMLLPVISKALGRDISVEVNLFYRTRAAIGASLNQQGQQFFAENWQHIPAFMETPAGRKASAQFINAWAASLIPQTLAAPPVEEPAPLPALADLPTPIAEAIPDTGNAFL